MITETLSGTESQTRFKGVVIPAGAELEVEPAEKLELEAEEVTEGKRLHAEAFKLARDNGANVRDAIKFAAKIKTFV